jgi:putrescine transport system substrate-binding protein
VDLRTLSLLVLALPLLAACQREAGEEARAARPVVHVYNWSDYITDAALRGFEAETGIRVVYDVYDANEMLEARLMAGRSGYDVVFPSARPFAQRHVEGGLYLALDRERLPHHHHLDPELLAGLAEIDPGNAHLVPYMWGTTGLGYNVARIAERLGEDFEPDGWSLLFDPGIAAELAGCGIAVLDDEQEAFAAALLWLGRDPNAPEEDAIEAVAAAYAAIRPYVRYFHSSRYIDDLANGEICLAMGYSGDVFQARDRAAEAGRGVEVGYVIPKEGALRWVDVMAIPADAPHPDSAHAFIDYLLRPEVIAPISEHIAYASANASARALLDPAFARDPDVHPPPEVAARLVDPRALPDEVQRARVRAWAAIKAGR